jgi:Ca-activated chloride channel family protein
MKTCIKYARTLVGRGERDSIDVLIEATGPDAPQSQRPPIDVVAVIDRSGSMSGEPLEAVKGAVTQLLRLVGPDDRMAVVVFDDSVDVVLPLEHHSLVEEAERAISRVQPGGMTNLSGGWLKAVQILTEQGRPEALRRVIVLTDGHANVGLSSAAEFAPHVVTARVAGITTSCIGFADGFDEEFLAAVADAGSGNDYWCAGPDQATAVFAAEFTGLASVVAQNLEVELSASDVVRNVKVRHELPVASNGSVHKVTLGDVYGGETRRVLVTLETEAIGELGPANLGQVTLTWVSVEGEMVMHTVELPIAVTVLPTLDGAVDEGFSPDVLQMAERLRAERHRRDARLMADAGDFSGALDSLSQASALFSRAGLHREAHLLVADMDALQSGAWSPAHSKKLYSQTRGTAKGRLFKFDADHTDSGDSGSDEK